VLNSYLGPRTLMTQAERSFDLLMKNLSREYRKPVEYQVRYASQDLVVIKEARWRTRDRSILLKYTGVTKDDTDQLILEMQAKGAG
jgi:hypothetical protein